MKNYYFPLVLGIILAELGLLVWLLAAIIPLNPEGLYLQEDAAYRPFISGQDAGSVQVIISQWLFFLLIAGFLIPVSGTMIGELVRWALDRRKALAAAAQAKEE
ncbi:MAG: hypothetical protein HYY29_01000 [Chloroflexi bacterium]|nr:hypothetical protein [Chloroflexota bacterium]